MELPICSKEIPNGDDPIFNQPYDTAGHALFISTIDSALALNYEVAENFNANLANCQCHFYGSPYNWLESIDMAAPLSMIPSA